MPIEELIFVRHGQTEWNVEGRFQGRGDSPLTPLGHQQVAAHLRWLPTRRPERLLASPLGRARATAELLAAELGLKVETDERLMERSMGRFEGWTLAEVATREPEHNQARGEDPWAHRPPGGENYDDLLGRVSPLVDELLAATERSILVVSHGTLGRVLLGSVLELDAATMLRTRLPNSVAYVVRLDGRAATVLRFDDGMGPEQGLLMYD